MLYVLPPTLKPVSQQMRLLQAAKSCCRKYAVVYCLGQTLCMLLVLPVRGDVSPESNLQQTDLLQDRFKTGWFQLVL